MKTYNVNYSYRTHFDTTITAKNEKEAKAKVSEVLGDVRFEGIWEVHEKSKEKQSA